MIYWVFAIHGPGDEIIFKPGTKPGITITKITGAKGKLPTDPEKNTAGVAAMSVMKYYDAENEAIEIEIRKKMPMASGMGSSAASAVAGAFGVAKYLRLGLQKKGTPQICHGRRVYCYTILSSRQCSSFPFRGYDPH